MIKIKKMTCKKCNQKEELKKEMFEMNKFDDKNLIKWIVGAMITSIYGVIAIIRDILSIFL